MIEISPKDRVFVLTGAGVSAESGIPTFRGEGGLWRNYRFEEVASPRAWERDPRLVWEFYSIRRRVAAVANPNPAHAALAELEHRLQDRLFLCTQNVDNLHERAGSRRAVHMHGELSRAAATPAIARHSMISACMSLPARAGRPPQFPGANVAAGFARTSAGSARCHTGWMKSSGRLTPAQSLSPSERREWLNRLRASSRKQADARARSMSARKNPPTGSHSPNASLERPGRCFRISFAADERSQSGMPMRFTSASNLGSSRRPSKEMKYLFQTRKAACC